MAQSVAYCRPLQIWNPKDSCVFVQGVLSQRPYVPGMTNADTKQVNNLLTNTFWQIICSVMITLKTKFSLFEDVWSMTIESGVMIVN